MSAGDRWQLPDGREAIELDGSRGGLLRLAPIVPGWPFPAPAEVAELNKAFADRFGGGE